MKIYLFLLIMLFSINKSFSQVSSNKVTGNWMFKGYVGKKQIIECPEILAFENGSYSIFNDCYGIDYENPIIEKGKWTFNANGNTVTLMKRKFITNYYFHGNKRILILYVKEINNKEMKVSFDSRNSSTVAIFERKKLLH